MRVDFLRREKCPVCNSDIPLLMHLFAGRDRSGIPCKVCGSILVRRRRLRADEVVYLLLFVAIFPVPFEVNLFSPVGWISLLLAGALLFLLIHAQLTEPFSVLVRGPKASRLQPSDKLK